MGAELAELKKLYVGRSLDTLPTPYLLINSRTVESNCRCMLEAVEKSGARFRAHVKTHKTTQITRQQLGHRPQSRIVVSTLAEAWAHLPLVQEGLVSDILYGLPPSKTRIPELVDLAKHVTVRLMIDHVDQVQILRDLSPSGLMWSIFVKVDMGSRRAGLESASERLRSELADLLLHHSDIVQLHGFYCHAGHSYSSQGLDEALAHLKSEIDAGKQALATAFKICPDLRTRQDKLVISVGATPTAHAAKLLLGPHPELVAELEIHAGNYPLCDLQQVATKCVDRARVACTVVAETLSFYPHRGDAEPGEILINAGVLALARETGPELGYAQVCTPGYEDWYVSRISQEHGILAPRKNARPPVPPVGTHLQLIPQHACITCNSYPYYLVTEDNLVVSDVYVPAHGW